MAVIVQRPPLSHTPFSSVIILLPNGWGGGRLFRNPVSLVIAGASAYREESLEPLGLPFSDGAFVAHLIPVGTTPDTRQPAPRRHHVRT